MAEPSFPMKLPSSPMGTPVVYLTEIRKESPASVVAFADACPCCGNKKRRCLYPSDDPRKKILIFDIPQTSTAPTVTTSSGVAATASLKSPSLNACNIHSLSSSSSSSSSSSATADPFPSSNPKRTLPPTVLSDHGSLRRHTYSDPATPPPPSEMNNPVAGAGKGRAPTRDRGFPERSNSSGVSCPAEDDKNQSQGSDDIRSSPKPAPAVSSSAEKAKGSGEVRLGIKCECGVTREFIFIP